MDNVYTGPSLLCSVSNRPLPKKRVIVECYFAVSELFEIPLVFGVFKVSNTLYLHHLHLLCIIHKILISHILILLPTYVWHFALDWIWFNGSCKVLPFWISEHSWEKERVTTSELDWFWYLGWVN